MNIAEMQSEVAKAQEDVGEGWRGSIIDSIHAYGDHHDLGKLFSAISKEYPGEYAEAVQLAELERIQQEAVEAADCDREQGRHH